MVDWETLEECVCAVYGVYLSIIWKENKTVILLSTVWYDAYT
jgi:hypothetical protein